MSEVIADFQLPIAVWCRAGELTAGLGEQKPAIGIRQSEI
jgi:hypothetical protein